MLRPHAAKLTFASAFLSFLSLTLFLKYNHFSPKNGRPTFDSYAQYTEYLNSHPSITSPASSIDQAAVSTTTTTATQLSTITTTGTPSPTATGIPEKLWYKTGPKGLPSESEEWIKQCLDRNPTYRHEFLTDESSEQYVRELYAERPEIVTTYFSLNIPILKADLLRYLILYANGGIWNDLDVSCEDLPIHGWIPSQYRRETGLVVGLEFDGPWEDDGELHTQFASWTILARPQSPHMLQVIEDILEDIHKMALEHDVPVARLDMGMIGDVVDVTGPKRMTRGIVKSLEHMLGETIDDRNVSGFTVPTLVGDVLILPGNAFSASQAGYPEDQGPALVTHHYAGTWKNEHGGEMTK